MSARLKPDAYFCNLVKDVALRGSCIRRKTGCILVDEHNHIVATGYNGRPRGFTECLVQHCDGAFEPSGQGLDKCEAIHAEANALIQCRDTESITTAYCTTAPCIHCVKMLINTSLKRIVFIEDYPHSQISRELCLQANIRWEQFPYGI